MGEQDARASSAALCSTGEANGNKSLAEIVKHLTEDELVAWGWEPGKDATGKDRQPVPIAKPEFNRIVHAWAKAGAACPNETYDAPSCSGAKKR